MLKTCIIILLLFSAQLFAQTPLIDPACLPVVTIKESQNNICLGSGVTFLATVTNKGTNEVYKWKKNNVDAGVNNNAYFTSNDFRDGDVVVCEYTCKAACGVDITVKSNPVTMHILNNIPPSITIANYDPLICEGELTVFTTTASYGNGQPSYQWFVNSKPVGSNSPHYSTSTLTNGSKIECVLSVTTPSCPGQPITASSQMVIYVYPMIHPTIMITPGKTQICRGEEVKFTATANGGAHPKFTWKLNGQQIGPEAPSLSITSLKNGDVVSCMVTIDQDSRCHTSTSAPSNDVVMEVKDYIDPTVTIASPNLNVCQGALVSFTATPQNAGSYQVYQWMVNDKIKGNGSATFISNQLANGDKISCILTTDIPGCSFTAAVPSGTEVVKIKSVPVITFLPSEVSVMRGEQGRLNASVSGNAASVAWTPEASVLAPHSLTTSTVPLIRDTVFNLTVVDANGCAASKEFTVKVLRKLDMPSAFTANDDGKNDVFRIPPDASLRLQEFSVFDRWGNVVFITSDKSKGWNGTYQDKKLATGTYIYVIKGIVLDKEVMVKGTVTLLR